MVGYPLLFGYTACGLVNDHVKNNIHTLQHLQETFDAEFIKNKVIWVPGCERVDWDEVLDIRDTIHKTTNKFIIEEPYPTNFLKFDQTMYPLIHDSLSLMTPGMAGRIEVWNFFNAALLPDVVTYRWRKRNSDEFNISDRFFNMYRNYIGSLWWRTYFFYDESNDDPYHILNGLTEDDFVQVLERPKLRGYPKLALAIGKMVSTIRQSNSYENIPGLIKNLVIRQALVDLRVEALGYDFYSIGESQEDLDKYVTATFARILRHRAFEFNKNPEQFRVKYIKKTSREK